MKRLLKKFLAVFMILIFIWPAYGAAAQENQAQGSRTVRVGYFYDGSYMYKSKDGRYRGYDVEYLFELSKYNSWKYSFVEYDSFEDECEALKRGEIDIIPAFFYSEDRSRDYIFSAENMGDVPDTLIVDADDSTHAYNDYEAIDGMTVGILAGSVDGENFRNWCSSNGISVNTVEMDSNEKLLSALKEGKIDGAAGSYIGADRSYRIVAEFSPTNMYFAMAKGNETLMHELDEAMSESRINNPDFRNSLYQKYFAAENQQAPIFTNSELKYLSEGKTVRVVLQTDSPPFSWIDSNGTFTGAVADMFDRIAEMSGLKFSYIGADNMSDALDMLRNDKAEIISRVTDDPIATTDYDVLLTNPYLKLSLERVSKRGTQDISIIAVSQSMQTIFDEKFRENNPEENIVYYNTAKQSFGAMDDGKADAAVIDSASASYLVNSGRASEYSLNALNSFDYSVAAGVTSHTDRNLYSIISKCIGHMSSSSVDELILNYTNAETNTFSSFMNRVPVKIIVTTVAVLLTLVVLLAMLGILLLMQMRKVQQLAREREESRKQEEAVKVAEKANQMKSEFFGNISHDMRTPLNAVLGYDALALQTEDEAVKKDYLEKIGRAGKLLLDLVNSTLMISKIENKKYELHMEPVDCSEMIHEVIISVNEIAQKKGICFRSDCSREHFGTIMADRLNLQKILLNLLSNAVNYTKSGGNVDFVFEELQGNDSDMNAVFTVRDTGVGISREFLPKIFEPFTQERTSENTNAGGSGLGLSIVKQLTELMGGSIAVKSELGVGTEFTVMMRLEEMSSKMYSEKNVHSTSRESIAGMRVLLCEDNDMNREIAVTMLNAKGISADTAADGREGLKLFAASYLFQYDAVLMDIRMPEMDGYETSRAIRKLGRADAGSVPIYAMSADAYEEDIRKCMEAGMNGHIPKPVEAERLYAVLAGACGSVK